MRAHVSLEGVICRWCIVAEMRRFLLLLCLCVSYLPWFDNYWLFRKILSLIYLYTNEQHVIIHFFHFFLKKPTVLALSAKFPWWPGAGAMHRAVSRFWHYAMGCDARRICANFLSGVYRWHGNAPPLSTACFVNFRLS